MPFSKTVELATIAENASFVGSGFDGGLGVMSGGSGGVTTAVVSRVGGVGVVSVLWVLQAEVDINKINKNNIIYLASFFCVIDIFIFICINM